MSENNPSRPGSSRVWWWIVAVCVLQAAAWIVWFAIAAQHRVAEVPLATG